MGTPTEWPRSESKVSSQSIWLSNTVPKLRDIECATSCSESCRPNCFAIEVTGFEAIPQGMIKSK